jgi:hypothetical protein
VSTCTISSREPERDPQFLLKTVTGDEMLVYEYGPETKEQSSQWKGPSPSCPKKASQVCSNMKSMLTISLDIQVDEHYEFVPQG